MKQAAIAVIRAMKTMHEPNEEILAEIARRQQWREQLARFRVDPVQQNITRLAAIVGGQFEQKQ